MYRLVSSLFALSALVACTDEGFDDEDAIADAAPTGKADNAAFSGPYTTTDIDHEDREPLIAIFHEDGQLDYVRFDDEYDSKYFQGTYKLYKYQGRDRIRLLDKDGRVLLRSDWSANDYSLEFGGETWTQSDPPTTNVVNCITVDVSDSNVFEEGLSVYEYPDVAVEREGTKYALSLGAASIDSTEAEIEVTDSATKLEVMAEMADNERLEIVVPKAAPRRGVINFMDETDGEHELASIVCR
jgi:hypothetical protein